MAADHPWIGVWQRSDVEGELLRITESFVITRKSGGSLRGGIRPVVHEATGLLVGGHQPAVHWQLQVEGDRLQVKMEDGATLTYQLVDDLPDQLNIAALEVSNPQPLGEQEREEVIAELTERATRIRSLEGRFKEVLQADGGEKQHPELAALKQEALDYSNESLRYLRGVVDRFGWPDAERFGADTHRRALMLALFRIDIPLLRTAEDHLVQFAGHGGPGEEEYAAVSDEIAKRLQLPVRYGRRAFTRADGILYLPLIDDLELVEENRRRIGLSPLAEYRRALQRRGKPLLVVLFDERGMMVRGFGP